MELNEPIVTSNNKHGDSSFIVEHNFIRIT